MIRPIVSLLAVGLALCARGQPTFSADVLAGDQKLQIGRGAAVFKDAASGLLLTADEIRYETENGRATALGHVVFTRGNRRLLADELIYQVSDGSFSAKNVRIGQYPFYAEGASAEGARDEFTIHQARIAYGEPGPWQPTLMADKVIYAPDQQIRTENARAGVGGVSFLPFPRLQRDLAVPFAGSIGLAAGYRRSLGVVAEAGVRVPITPMFRLGGDVGIYTNRGVMIGPAGRYSDPENAERLRGYFRSGYINDHGPKGTDLLGRPVPEERGYVEWQHEQLLAPNLGLKAQLNWWNDSEVVRDFRPRAFFPVQQPDTFVEAVHVGANYLVSAFARFQPNSFHRVQERLPEVRFDLLPSALGNGFHHRLHASAAVLREDPVIDPRSLALTVGELRSDRLDAYYGIERPFAVRDWLAITPVAGGRVTHYANTRGVARAPGQAGDYTRTLGELGVDAALRASGTFDYKNEQWKIDGLRHLFTPRVSYRYIPHGDRGRGRIPAIDRRARIERTDYLPYLQPLGLGDVRNIDELRATNTLRLGFDNVVQTRDAREGTRDLLAFNIANDFRFKRRRGERDVSEIHTELSVMPARWLQFDVYQSVAPQSMKLREFNSGLTLRDGEVWSLRFANNYLRGELEDYLIEARTRFTESYEGFTRLHYDARRRRFNEQSYGLAHNLGKAWLISYSVSLYSGRKRESSFGFNVEIEALRF